MTTEERLDAIEKVLYRGNGTKSLTERMGLVEQTMRRLELAVEDINPKLDTLLRRSTTWNKAEFWKTARWTVTTVLALAAVVLSLLIYWRENHPHESIISSQHTIVAQYDSRVPNH